MKYNNWEKEFERLTNKEGFCESTCTNWHIDMYAKEIKPFIKDLLAQEKENWLEELESRQIKE